MDVVERARQWNHTPYVDVMAILADAAEEIEKLRAEVSIRDRDLSDAAGEMVVPIPEPGTVEAKMMIANRLLKAELEAERKARSEAEDLFSGQTEVVCCIADALGFDISRPSGEVVEEIERIRARVAELEAQTTPMPASPATEDIHPSRA